MLDWSLQTLSITLANYDNYQGLFKKFSVTILLVIG